LIDVSFLILQICLVLVSAAFAVEEKTVKKRGLVSLGYGGLDLSGLSGLGGYDGGYGGHSVAIAVKEKAVAVPVAVPQPVAVPVDRPYPVKVI